MNYNSKTSIFNLFIEANKCFTRTIIMWLIILFLLTFGEITLNIYTNETPKNLKSIITWALYNTFIFWSKWALIQYVIYTPTYIINKNISKITLYCFLLIISLSQLILITYHNTALVPLGADIYSYSIEDINQTIGASGGLSLISILLLIATLSIITFLLKLSNNNNNASLKLTSLILILSIITNSTNINSFIKAEKFNNEYANNLIIHKTHFFYNTSVSHFFPEVYEIDIYADSYIGDYEGKEVTTTSFEYIDEKNYPFLHLDNTPDVLGTYFKKNETPPNIVIILVEGLGRAFTNEDAYLGNFTPFLDSISQHSLYWKNFLSQGGRTFAVLPSLLGSLPFGKNGFLGMGKKMPKHLSLINIANNNNYNTSFYYGGKSKFDNMKMFLKANNIDYINDYDSFPTTATKLPDNNGFSWGYSDKALFNFYLENNKTTTNKPQLNILLTVAMHSPFIIEEQEKYNLIFKERMNFLNFNNTQKQNHNKYIKQYASILYTDDAIKDFFTKYKTRKDFKNTIFLITGDHRMPEIPMSTKIDRYHVPLIVYSPMLTKTKTISSISTHFDVTPSIIAFLKNNYNIKSPKYVSWMGDGLDTIPYFQNRHSYPLIQTKTDLNDYIMGNYHLNGSNLFEIDMNMGETNIEDFNIKNRLNNMFNTFKRKNNEIENGKKLIPDSIYNKYTK